MLNFKAAATPTLPFPFSLSSSNNRHQLDVSAEELESRGEVATNTMREHGEIFKLWFRERGHNIFVDVEDGGDGEGKLLRYSWAESTEKRDY